MTRGERGEIAAESQYFSCQQKGEEEEEKRVFWCGREKKKLKKEKKKERVFSLSLSLFSSFYPIENENTHSTIAERKVSRANDVLERKKYEGGAHARGTNSDA